MATKENTSTEQQRIEAAEACMRALCQAVETRDALSRMETPQESFRRKDDTATKIMALAGPLPPRAAGVLGLLVELAIDSIENGYTIDEQVQHANRGYQYEPTMTAHQVESYRAKSIAEMEAAA